MEKNLNDLYVIVHQHHRNVVQMFDDDVYDDDEDQHVLFVQLFDLMEI
jgi:hypothetical protein